MIEKRIKGASGYAPGKHPNSHMKRRNAIQQRRERIQDKLSGMFERLSKVPGDTAKAAKQHLETANDRMSGLNHKEALRYYKRARNLINHLSAGHRTAVIGKIQKAKTKSGYAPGKNPASHGNRGKGLMANRSGKVNRLTSGDKRIMAESKHYGEKVGDNRYEMKERNDTIRGALKDSRTHLMEARKAKEAGHKGKVSFHADMARRLNREAKGQVHEATFDGINQSRGAKLYDHAINSEAKVRTHMNMARFFRGRGQEYKSSVANARSSSKSARRAERLSRMTKREDVEKARGKSGYAPGKNPNSHKRKGSALSNRTGSTKLTERDNTLAARRGHATGNKDYAASAKDSLKSAKRSIVAARKAKSEGNLGEASYHASNARYSTRLARGARTKDVTRYTEGAGAHVSAYQARAERTVEMNRARKAKATMGEHAKPFVDRSVRNARRANRESRMHAAQARVTKTDIFVPIVKADAKEQVVYGWASPIKELGSEIIDRQGDVIDMSEVRQAAHEFMLHKRVGGSMHKQFDVGQVVESIVFDADIQKALGIDLPYEGWFIGVKVSKKEDWEKVESGEYTGFSIGGSGIREPIEAEIIGKARGKSGYAPGKNPNSHRRGGVGFNPKGHDSLTSWKGERGGGFSMSPAAKKREKAHNNLKAAKDWMAEARDVKSHNPDQAAYAVMQARKAVRRARGSSTKTGAGKSAVARAARRFSRSSANERD